MTTTDPHRTDPQHRTDPHRLTLRNAAWLCSCEHVMAPTGQSIRGLRVLMCINPACEHGSVEYVEPMFMAVPLWFLQEPPTPAPIGEIAGELPTPAATEGSGPAATTEVQPDQPAEVSGNVFTPPTENEKETENA